MKFVTKECFVANWIVIGLTNIEEFRVSLCLAMRPVSPRVYTSIANR